MAGWRLLSHKVRDTPDGGCTIDFRILETGNGTRDGESDFLRTENKRLKEEIIMLKTQLLGGSENDSCAIEGMDEAQALKDEDV